MFADIFNFSGDDPNHPLVTDLIKSDPEKTPVETADAAEASNDSPNNPEAASEDVDAPEPEAKKTEEDDDSLGSSGSLSQVAESGCESADGGELADGADSEGRVSLDTTKPLDPADLSHLCTPPSTPGPPNQTDPEVTEQIIPEVKLLGIDSPSTPPPSPQNLSSTKLEEGLVKSDSTDSAFEATEELDEEAGGRGSTSETAQVHIEIVDPPQLEGLQERMKLLEDCDTREQKGDILSDLSDAVASEAIDAVQHGIH